MPVFVALSSRGIRDLLVEELSALGVRRPQPRGEGVEFEGSWELAYKIHLKSRLATRILLPILDFKAYNEDDLYHGIRRHDFTQWIDVQQKFRIESHVRDHKQLRDQRFVALKVKDAIADQFRDKFDVRPDVGKDDQADLKVVVRVAGPDVSVAIDVTGQPLSFRGYRARSHEAPIREHVAAALVDWSSWMRDQVLLDPFCGTGTILIEAALKAANLPPNRKRRGYSFERLKNFQSAKYNELRKPDVRRVSAPKEPMIFGSDWSPDAVQGAKLNAEIAGVANWIQFKTRDVHDIEPPAPTGIILTNPPYGDRVADNEKVKALMKDFASVLKTRFKGWDLWILSGHETVSSSLGLKAARRIEVWNGPIECRLLHYQIR